MGKALSILSSLVLVVTIAEAQEKEKTAPVVNIAQDQNGEVAVVPNDSTKDPGLKAGDIAPSWAIMAGPGKFEFLKNWTEEKGKRLRKPMSQPDRHVVVMSFFATWCKPCMKELPHLQNLYDKYEEQKIKFFLMVIRPVI